MNRRGMALLTALWFLVVGSGLALTLVARARLGVRVSGDRDAIRLGRWAAEGCLAILRDSAASGPMPDSIATVDLGDGIWCRATVEDPGAALNVNRADIAQLRALLGSDSVAAAVVDWIDPDNTPVPGGAERQWYEAQHRRGPRNAPIPDVAELNDVRGFDARFAPLQGLLTARGTGRINVNRAPAEVLTLLPGMDPAYARTVVRERSTRHGFSGLDELVARAPPAARAALSASYGDLVRTAVFGTETYVVRLEGGVGRDAAALEIATLVPAGVRVAVVGKEVW